MSYFIFVSVCVCFLVSHELILNGWRKNIKNVRVDFSEGQKNNNEHFPPSLCVLSILNVSGGGGVLSPPSSSSTYPNGSLQFISGQRVLECVF